MPDTMTGQTSNDGPWVTMAPGIRRRTLVSGVTMSQMRVTLEAGSALPEHRHPEEQIVHVVHGRLRVTVDGRITEVAAGESLYLAGGVLHFVEALEATVVTDTFSPPREDLLAQDRTLARSGEKNNEKSP